MLSEYKIDKSKYHIGRLKNQVILIGENALKDIVIDVGGESYIETLLATPLLIECFDLSFEETSGLGGRYEFEKTVSFSVGGYANPNELFGARRRIILETEDGCYRLVNVDFDALMTYEYTLEDGNDFTKFTFHSYSNFPSLKVTGNFGVAEKVCGYSVYGGLKLDMNYFDSVRLDRTSGVVSTVLDEFVGVEFNTLTFNESFDGNAYTDTLSFTIPIVDYKSSWHYNLEEFKRNRYAAIIGNKTNKNILCGFNTGLVPNYDIIANDEDDSYITITLREISNIGCLVVDAYTEEELDGKHMVPVKRLPEDDVVLFECVRNGIAQYLLKKEVDAFGRETGNYRCLTGWTEYYEDYGFNIVGTFDFAEEFASNECFTTLCSIATNIPSPIIFNGIQSFAYTISSTCDWSIGTLPSGITVSRSSGIAGESYTIRISNTIAAQRSSSFVITSGDATKTIGITVMDDGFVSPSEYNIDCLNHTVRFYYNPSCQVTLTNPSSLPITFGNGWFDVEVPSNGTESTRTFTIAATDCNSDTQTLTINQDKLYSDWRRVDNEYICASGQAYVLLTLFTGTTSSNLVQTSEKKVGGVIEGSSECSSIYTRWQENGYICNGNNKYKRLEEQYSYDQVNWYPTGNYTFGDFVSEDSSYCGSVETRWVLTDQTTCDA